MWGVKENRSKIWRTKGSNGCKILWRHYWMISYLWKRCMLAFIILSLARSSEIAVKSKSEKKISKRLIGSLSQCDIKIHRDYIHVPFNLSLSHISLHLSYPLFHPLHLSLQHIYSLSRSLGLSVSLSLSLSLSLNLFQNKHLQYFHLWYKSDKET